jgi:hypothetical protein
MQLSRQFCDYSSPYSSFDQIPDSKKLHNYERQFQGNNTWEVFLSEQYNLNKLNNETVQHLEKAGTQWKSACDGKCHHACASPRSIDEWSINLVEEISLTHAYKYYLLYINKFYRFLMWHIDYPHSYNPVQFAVSKYQETEKIWYALQE